MKEESVEIEIPTGYEYDYHVRSKAEDDIIKIHLKKQTVKDFNWYVDEYLTNKNGSTIDTITNLIKDHILESVRNLTKEKNYSLVPWEIKIGLFKFICDDKKLYWVEEMGEYDDNNMAHSIKNILPIEFTDDLFKTK